MIAVEIVFWLCAGLIVYTHVGYPVVLWILTRRAGAGSSAASGRRPSSAAARERTRCPLVSLIVAAYDEEEVIDAKVANALALDYPRERLELIVASDGSADATVERARAAGADLVLDLPRGGKVAAQNAAAERASRGDRRLLRRQLPSGRRTRCGRLVEPFADPAVGYVCGQVRFTDAAGGNLEGAYWRYEMAVREMESALAGVTAGNGAHLRGPARGLHRRCLPPAATTSPSPSPSPSAGCARSTRPGREPRRRWCRRMEGEFARKRRMMVGLWDIVVGEGMLSPRGYSPLYAFELASHRLLRYLTPVPAPGRLRSPTWRCSAGAGSTSRPSPSSSPSLAAALLGRALPLAPLRFARYYALTTASIAAGLWDRARRGAPGTWEKAEGTRA